MGASPLFPPQHPSIESARDQLLHLARREARSCGCDQTRWTLQAFRSTCPWLHDLTLAGVHSVLDRLDVVWKRARSYVHSPDPNYIAKRADIATLRERAQLQPGRFVVVYLDEVTIERQPSVSNAYAARGKDQARARRSWSANSETRVVATLDADSGRVVFRRGRVTIAALVAFYEQLRAAYPHAERIYVVLDNWPVHFHPDVLIALEPQESQWPLVRPKHWATTPRAAAVRKWSNLQLPIQLVPLPTYASWCNPIEKLWRKLRQDLTHLHHWADDLPGLREAIDRFLGQFATGSEALLRYVGLGVPD